MKKRKYRKMVDYGKYVVEVDVELIIDSGDWSTYLSVEDAGKLDYVRKALQKGDLGVAKNFDSVYELTPVHI